LAFAVAWLSWLKNLLNWAKREAMQHAQQLQLQLGKQPENNHKPN